MNGTQKKTSLKDIAQAAGVSTSLVSFVLNGKWRQHRISEQVAEKIMKLAKEMNYQPNIMAKSLRAGKSQTIGVVVSDISNTFFANLAHHIYSTADKYDYAVIICSTDENAEKTNTLVDNLLHRGVDGIILVPCENSEPVVRKLQEMDFPFVLLDRSFPDLKTSFVRLDSVSASYEATQHLISQGYNHVAMIAYESKIQHMVDRVEGYRNAMIDAGLSDSILVKYVKHGSITKGCQKAIDSIIENSCDAVVTATNNISMECIGYMIDKGIKVPDNLGIVGFDGGRAFDFFYSPISYIKQPLEVMARKATEILIEQIEHNGNMTQFIEVSGELVARKSSSKL